MEVDGKDRRQVDDRRHVSRDSHLHRSIARVRVERSRIHPRCRRMRRRSDVFHPIRTPGRMDLLPYQVSGSKDHHPNSSWSDNDRLNRFQNHRLDK